MKWLKKFASKISITFSNKTTEEVSQEYADVIVHGLVTSELTVRQQSAALLKAIDNLKSKRVSEIEETRQRLAILEEDLNSLNQ